MDKVQITICSSALTKYLQSESERGRARERERETGREGAKGREGERRKERKASECQEKPWVRQRARFTPEESDDASLASSSVEMSLCVLLGEGSPYTHTHT